MSAVHHPTTDALYERDADGNVRVTDGELSGLFDSTGRFLEGELEECDPQLCRWVGAAATGTGSLAAAPAPLRPGRQGRSG